MGTKVKLSCGFASVETDVNLSDPEQKRWADFLGDIRDYRILSSPLNAEYVGEVFSAVVRLRDQVLPEAERGLPIDSGLRESYAKMRLAVRNFLTSVRCLGRENLINPELSLADVKPIGHQWIMVAALAELRRTFVDEIDINCRLLGGKVPEELKPGFELSDEIAEEWAQEVAPLPLHEESTGVA